VFNPLKVFPVSGNIFKSSLLYHSLLRQMAAQKQKKTAVK